MDRGIERVRYFAFGIAAVLFFIVVVCCSSGAAWAMDSEEAYGKFTASELSRLLCECSESSARFVACDYNEDGAISRTYYLKVRSEYASRYAAIVGDDKADLASLDDGIDGQVMVEERPLAEVPDSEIYQSPWNKVLYLKGENHYQINDSNYLYRGSGFLVSDNVGVTAAHCVFPTKEFARQLSGYVSVNSGDSVADENSPGTYVRTAIVKKEWVDSASESYSSDGKPTASHDTEYDFAMVVFREPHSTSGSCFSYESVSMLEGLTFDINLAGYPGWYGGQERYRLYRNEYDGKVGVGSLSSGNIFRILLSSKPGMSGGPVYTVIDGRYVAIGFMSTGDRNDAQEDPNKDTTYGANYACRITESLQVLIAWANEEGWKNTASTSVNPPSPSTGIENLTEEEMADQQFEQYVIQTTDLDGMSEAFDLARSINPEVCAWLYVPGTGVSLPVARHEGDNSYYLDHSFRGEDCALGCVYMEEADSPAFDQPLTVLYGHSFPRNSLMLTRLHAFEDESFFEEHDLIYVLTEDGMLTYQIAEAALYKGSHIASFADESDTGSLQRYLDNFASTSDDFTGYRRPVALDAFKDKVLQLSTCTVPTRGDARFVVTGVLVDAG